MAENLDMLSLQEQNTVVRPLSSGERTLPSVAPESGCETKEAILNAILRNPRIPSPPTIALKIFQKLGELDCDVNEVTTLLAHDPGLSAKVLKTMNSALQGRTRAVTSVRQATVMLGSNRLRSLILGLALPIMQEGLEADAGLQRFWKRSVAGAVMARELAERCQWPAPEDELAAGLLRNVGMLLLQQNYGERYSPVWCEQDAVATDAQCAWEEDHFGVHHAEVGAALLERWQLPIELVEPIRFHHHPHQTPDLVTRLVDSAHLLDFVTRLTDLNVHAASSADMKELLQTAHVRYGLERSSLEEFFAVVRPRIAEFSDILGVDIGESPDFSELLVRGCDELVRVSLEGADMPCADPASSSQTVVQAQSDRSNIRDMLCDPGGVHASSKILHYEVVEVIGRGAMGIVLKALDPRLSRLVAIKLLAPELLSSETARQRFSLEARHAASVRHENIVAIHTVDELDGVPFLVMEFVDGSSLAQLLEQKSFTVDEIARIGRQTALGLAAAHEVRLIHRDVKPDNILIEKDTMHVRLADFGLARAADEDFHISRPGLLIGTPNYMSPEQVDGKSLTPASDLFSLASVLYTLCTGRLPFESETVSGLLRGVAEKQPTPIRTLNPRIPQELARIIEKLHAKNPCDRPASAALVADWLQPWCF